MDFDENDFWDVVDDGNVVDKAVAVKQLDTKDVIVDVDDGWMVTLFLVLKVYEIRMYAWWCVYGAWYVVRDGSNNVARHNVVVVVVDMDAEALHDEGNVAHLHKGYRSG